MIRDEKGRFVSTKNTIEYGNNKNKKENGIMMNGRERRMEELKKNGVNVDDFFDLSMRIPFGAEVKIVVDGKEMIVPANQNFTQGIGSCGDVVYNINAVDSSCYPSSGMTVATNVNVESLSKDHIVSNIMDNGYIFNSRVDGRFVTAHMFKMLKGISYNYKTGKHEVGYDAYLRNCYSYMYQFDMMLDEVHRLARMEKDGDKDFHRLSQFFTKEVVYETCKQYIRQLKKYINSQRPRKCQGKPYVKLNKYGNIFISDLNDKIFYPLRNILMLINEVDTYYKLEQALKSFMNIMCKLPYDTPKCSQWKVAFKGKGSYVTLLNIIKFHNVNVVSYETGILLDRDSSIAYVQNKLTEYKGQYWRFHELLKATIKANNFDLKKSIESQK